MQIGMELVLRPPTEGAAVTVPGSWQDSRKDITYCRKINSDVGNRDSRKDISRKISSDVGNRHLIFFYLDDQEFL